MQNQSQSHENEWKTGKQTLWDKEQELIVNEEALKYAYPQCITHTTSA